LILFICQAKKRETILLVGQKTGQSIQWPGGDQMKSAICTLLVAAALLLASCAAMPSKEDQAQQLNPEPAEETATPVAELQAPCQYPIAPGIWVPGDGPLPAHPFKYYRIRCWPGCHDPNSQPRSHNY
jgi:hypothetical protein